MKEQTNETREERTVNPREAAVHFVRPYFERGDSIEQLAAGQMGASITEYAAQIGGYVYFPDKEGERLYPIKRDEVAITRLLRQKCLHRYMLKELQAEITSGYSQKGLGI